MQNEQTLKNQAPETGAASVKVELKNSVLTIYHGTSGEVLFQKLAFKGDWAKMWNEFINVQYPEQIIKPKNQFVISK